MKRMSLIAAGALALAAAPVLGAETAAGAIPGIKEGAITGVAALAVFVIVAVLLGKFVWPKINAGLEDRAAKIRDEIAAAELAQQQARESLEQYERNLAEARAEAQKMIEEARSRQQQIAVELRAKADVELGAMRERAMKDIDAARRAAINEIYAEAAELATKAAGKILQREISPEDQRRLVEESLSELSGVSRN
jgi:F-type H+-transporting ATPase subunit b